MNPTINIEFEKKQDFKSNLVIQRPEGPIILDRLDESEIELWWNMYDNEFLESNKNSPCRQSFYKEEFVDALNSQQMTKLAYIKDGEIASLCLLSNDLDLFPWLSKEYYKNNFPDEYNSGDLLYFVSLLTKEEYRRQDYASEIIELLTDLVTIESKEHRVIFDCTEKNAEFLPLLIEEAIGGTGKAKIKFDKIGTQIYWAGKVSLIEYDKQ